MTNEIFMETIVDEPVTFKRKKGTSIMDSYGIPTQRMTPTDAMYYVPSNFFLETTKRWAFNRPSDLKRAAEIAKRIKKIGFVEGVFFVALTVDEDKDEHLVCYDGNHRRAALRLLLEEDSETQYTVAVTISTDLSKISIVDRYKNLNKAIPVPDLYKKTVSLERKKLSLRIANRIAKEWGACVKSTRNPRKPNFNVGNLADMIYIFLDEKEADITYEKFMEHVWAVNKMYSKNEKLLRPLTALVTRKVKTTSCYLFLKSNFTEDITLE